MIDTYDVAHNLVLNTYYLPPVALGWNIQEDAVEEHATKLVEEFDVRTPSVHTLAGNLSGGNQQKMVVAREFSREVKLLIAAQPTRGIDVGSIEFIHNQIVAKRDEGVAVLVVSSELDEIMALADRIAVMYKGEIVAMIPRAEATREALGLLMAGVRQEEIHSSQPSPLPV
jgi:simple sugar transport system ATP-binding protein